MNGRQQTAQSTTSDADVEEEKSEAKDKLSCSDGIDGTVVAPPVAVQEEASFADTTWGKLPTGNQSSPATTTSNGIDDNDEDWGDFTPASNDAAGTEHGVTQQASPVANPALDGENLPNGEKENEKDDTPSKGEKEEWSHEFGDEQRSESGQQELLARIPTLYFGGGEEEVREVIRRVLADAFPAENEAMLEEVPDLDTLVAASGFR